MAGEGLAWHGLASAPSDSDLVCLVRLLVSVSHSPVYLLSKEIEPRLEGGGRLFSAF